MRKNRHITDLKYTSKRKLESIKRKLEGLAVEWGDTDMFVASKIESHGGLMSQIDEIISEIDGIDPKTH